MKKSKKERKKENNLNPGPKKVALRPSGVLIVSVEGEVGFSGHLCCRRCHAEDRRSGTGDAFLCAAATKTWSHDAFVSKHRKNRCGKLTARHHRPAGRVASVTTDQHSSYLVAGLPRWPTPLHQAGLHSRRVAAPRRGSTRPPHRPPATNVCWSYWQQPPAGVTGNSPLHSCAAHCSSGDAHRGDAGRCRWLPLHSSPCHCVTFEAHRTST